MGLILDSSVVIAAERRGEDRKSTRLSSSHGYISYAVFCLKKKKNKFIMLAIALKPQDIVVILKLCEYDPNRPPFARMPADLSIIPSELHAALKRAKGARLI